MRTYVKEKHDQDYELTWKNGHGPRQFTHQRINRFILSILVMLVCFPLYYLGFFGSVEGPLQPVQIGQWLADIGVSKNHILVLFTSLTILTVTWNWIFNLSSLLIGSRLTCKWEDRRGLICGVPVIFKKIFDKKTDRFLTQYVCSRGHKRHDAHFHPVKKGTVSHAVWMISLAGFFIMLFRS